MMEKQLIKWIYSWDAKILIIMKYEGLKPGDKVVTSSYENYGTMQELVLKK